MEQPLPPRFVSIMKACEIAQVSRRTMYNWLNSGKLTTYKLPSGLKRIDRLELLVRQHGKPESI